MSCTSNHASDVLSVETEGAFFLLGVMVLLMLKLKFVRLIEPIDASFLLAAPENQRSLTHC
jgi:hypothetical protein